MPVPDLPLVLDRAASEPLSRQLAGLLRRAAGDGVLAAGDRLPSGRTLAATLGVSRTVVTEAYQQLYAEGWLEGRHGSGTYVAAVGAPTRAPQDRPRSDVERPGAAGRVLVADLTPGLPWVGGLDSPGWRRAWRAAAVSGPVLTGTPVPQGLPGLRHELAGYLRRSRGIGCDAADILVTRGATRGLALLAQTVLRPGDRVGIEEPGYRKARNALGAHGCEVVPCPVDEHGLLVDRLPEGLRLVYTTPSHQFPLGGVLPVPRRQALVAWARRTGALVAEDDYDGEFRYDVAPLPALYGLDPEVVVYLGTTTKILSPAVGIGWLVAGPGLVAAVARRGWELSDRPSVLAQEAVRRLLAEGTAERHVRRMRGEYARRRQAVVSALAGHRLRGDTAGLHVVVELPEAAAERVVAEAARRGVLVDTLASFHIGPPYPQHGLVLGYGSVEADALARGCAVLAELLKG